MAEVQSTEGRVAQAHTVALLGGGVIGGGWAARFLLAGVDVRLYDPDPQAERKLTEILANARTAWSSLTDAPLPPEGRWVIVASVAEAVSGADFVQESAPERLVVGHPFNPVYLLPLVEVCPGARTTVAAVERAMSVYESVGMKPLRIRKEVDGFVADRLLEALWREALWLVNDGVATVEEVDDAIRYGAGLRWSFMGTFLTYRIAGGEGGMRHFMEQFGPALQWPWTKLMDVPALTDELLDTIEEQSDEQAQGADVRDLERLRDRCLVAVMQGLREIPYASGETLAAYEDKLRAR